MANNNSSIFSLLKKMFRLDIVVGLATIIGTIYGVKSFYKEAPKESTVTVVLSDDQHKDMTEKDPAILVAKKKQKLLERFKGDYTFVEHIGSSNYVYNLYLDPINSKAEWIEGNVHIKNSKGYCGTQMRWTEAWEVTNFSISEIDNSAIAVLVGGNFMDEYHDNDCCKVKLEFDEYDRILMKYIDGNSAPSVLAGEDDQYTNIAVFSREN